MCSHHKNLNFGAYCVQKVERNMTKDKTSGKNVDKIYNNDNSLIISFEQFDETSVNITRKTLALTKLGKSIVPVRSLESDNLGDKNLDTLSHGNLSNISPKKKRWLAQL